MIQDLLSIRLRWATRFAVMLAIVAIASMLTAHLLPSSAAAEDSAAIINVVQRSQEAEQTLCVPPGVSRTSIQPTSHATVSYMMARVTSTEQALYVGHMLNAQAALLRRSCSAAATGGQSRMIDGGVRQFTCASISVNGGSATADCQAIEWQKSLVMGANGVDVVDPTGPVNISDALQRTADGWRITDEHISFPAGSGP